MLFCFFLFFFFLFVQMRRRDDLWRAVLYDVYIRNMRDKCDIIVPKCVVTLNPKHFSIDPQARENEALLEELLL